ncbi:MAG: hypothetical protein ABL964_15680 [Steroidobacteraceae bacterium]
MPFRLLLLYGAIGGLASVLMAALARSMLATGKRSAPAAMPPPLLPTWKDVIEAGTHVLAGAGIGLLFWLSWGFAAIVTVPWWVRGLAFGGACALTVAVPALVGAAIRTGVRRGQAGVLLLEWSYTCLMAGLACAWIAEAVL